MRGHAERQAHGPIRGVRERLRRLTHRGRTESAVKDLNGYLEGLQQGQLPFRNEDGSQDDSAILQVVEALHHISKPVSDGEQPSDGRFINTVAHVTSFGREVWHQNTRQDDAWTQIKANLISVKSRLFRRIEEEATLITVIRPNGLYDKYLVSVKGSNIPVIYPKIAEENDENQQTIQSLDALHRLDSMAESGSTLATVEEVRTVVRETQGLREQPELNQLVQNAETVRLGLEQDVEMLTRAGQVTDKGEVYYVDVNTQAGEQDNYKTTAHRIETPDGIVASITHVGKDGSAITIVHRAVEDGQTQTQVYVAVPGERVKRYEILSRRNEKQELVAVEVY